MPAPLGEFETLVLIALLRLGDDAYGMAVRREITDRTDREVAIGAVYATLERLESKGLVTSATGATTAGRGGRARRFFAVTAKGRAALFASQRALTRMLDGVTLGPA
jgi:PadR family transcriptional regulator, regulatory protein PadR